MYYLACCPSGTTVPSVDPDRLEQVAEQLRQQHAALTGRLLLPASSQNGTSGTGRAASSSASSSARFRNVSLALETMQRRMASSHSSGGAAALRPMPPPPLPYSSSSSAGDRPRPLSALQRQKMYAAPSIPLRRGLFGDDASQDVAALLDSGDLGGGGERPPSSARTMLHRAIRSGSAALQAGIAPSNAAHSVLHETGHGGGGASGSAVPALGPRSTHTLSRGFTCGLCLQKYGASTSSMAGGRHGADGDEHGGDGGGGGASSSSGAGNAANSAGGAASSGGAAGGGSLLASRRKQRELEQQHGDNVGSTAAKPAALVSVRAIVEMRNTFLAQQQQQQQSASGGGGGALGSDNASTMLQSGLSGDIVPGTAGTAVYAGKQNRCLREDLRAAQSAVQHGYETVALCRFCAQFFGVYLGHSFAEDEAKEQAALARLARDEERDRRNEIRAKAAQLRRQKRAAEVAAAATTTTAATDGRNKKASGELRKIAAEEAHAQRDSAERQRKRTEQQQKRVAAAYGYHDSLVTVEATSPAAKALREAAGSNSDDDGDGDAASRAFVPRRPSSAAAGPPIQSSRRMTLPFVSSDTPSAAAAAAQGNAGDDSLCSPPPPKQRAATVSPSPPPGGKSGDDLAFMFDYDGPRASERRAASYLASLRRRAKQLVHDPRSAYSPSATAATAFASQRAERRRKIAMAQRHRERAAGGGEKEQQVGGAATEDEEDDEDVRRYLIRPMSQTALARLACRDSLDSKTYKRERKMSMERHLQQQRRREGRTSPSSSSASSSSPRGRTRSAASTPVSSPIQAELDTNGAAPRDDGVRYFLLDDKPAVAKDKQAKTAGSINEEDDLANTAREDAVRMFGTDLTNNSNNKTAVKEQGGKNEPSTATSAPPLQPTHSVASVTVVTAALSGSVVPTCVAALLPRLVDPTVEETMRVARLELIPPSSSSSAASTPVQQDPTAAAFIAAWKDKAAVGGQQQQQQQAVPLKKSHFVLFLGTCRTAASTPCCAETASRLLLVAPAQQQHHDHSVGSFGLVVDGVPRNFCLSCTLMRMAAEIAAAASASTAVGDNGGELFVVLDCTVPAAKIKAMWRNTVLRFPNVTLVCAASSRTCGVGSVTAALLARDANGDADAAVSSVGLVSPIRSIQRLLLINAEQRKRHPLRLLASSSSSSSSLSAAKRATGAVAASGPVVFYELQPNSTFLRRPSRALQLPPNFISSHLRLLSISDASSLLPAGGSSKKVGGGQNKSNTNVVGVALLLDPAAPCSDVSLAHAARMQRAVLQHFDGVEDEWDARVCATIKGQVFVFLMPRGLSVSPSGHQHQQQRYPLPTASSSSQQSVLDPDKVVLIAAHVLARRKQEGRLKALAGIDVVDVAVLAAATRPTAAVAAAAAPAPQELVAMMIERLRLRSEDEPSDNGGGGEDDAIVDFLP